MTVFGNAFFFEPWWVQIIKALVIFLVIFAVLPILTI